MKDLTKAATDLMDYLAFMVATSNRRYPFRPSPEGETKLAALRDAIQRDEKPAVVAPIIHLNGSGRQNLIDALAAAYSAIDSAAEAIKQTAPNGRDYYPAGPEALEAARKQYTRRIRALRDLQDELNEEIYLIEEQGQ
jgi:hypothetical protein